MYYIEYKENSEEIMNEYKYWKVKLENQIFWVLLDRSEKKNAFSDKVGNELYQILEEEVEGNLDKI